MHDIVMLREALVIEFEVSWLSTSPREFREAMFQLLAEGWRLTHISDDTYVLLPRAQGSA